MNTTATDTAAAREAWVLNGYRQAVREIVQDAQGAWPGLMEATSFAELHDVVDANEYGGLTEDDKLDSYPLPRLPEQDTWARDEYWEDANRIQDLVDAAIQRHGNVAGLVAHYTKGGSA